MELYQQILGDEHPDTLLSMNNVAVLYRRLNRFDEGRELAIKAMELR